MRNALALVTMIVALTVTSPVTAAGGKAVPYWVSIVPGRALMRTGPGREFPARWEYQRAGLPLKVVAVYTNWRKVADPDGELGWMQANLLTDARTGLVTGGIRPLHAAKDEKSATVWRAEPGVVGKISQCSDGWCLFDAKGKVGYIAVDHLWGVGASERLP